MTPTLDADAIRRLANEPLRERLQSLEVFDAIGSTNSHLMEEPGPDPGMIKIAATTNQTAGRGRQGKTWESPPGSGIAFSAAYTFAKPPPNLPALTLVLGLGAVDALEELGATGLMIKWPNDLVAHDGKLGGILTEAQPGKGGAVTIVVGMGINLDLKDTPNPAGDTGWAKGAVDLRSICDEPATHDEIAGKLATHVLQAFVDFEQLGFAAVAAQWRHYDWLQGRDITADSGGEPITGKGAGVADDGALLISTVDDGIQRVGSGSITVGSVT